MERREPNTGAIIDSSITLVEALSGPFEINPPQEVLDLQALVDVYYYSFDDLLHKGQIVVDQGVAEDVKDAFELIRRLRFPVKSVIPLGDLRFMNDDEKSMLINNSSGFCYRRIAKLDKLSNHSFGRAIDINPYQNPYIRKDYHFPPEVEYNSSIPGAFIADSEIVNFFKSRGWDWGGDWSADWIDYMHFQKPQNA